MSLLGDKYAFEDMPFNLQESYVLALEAAKHPNQWAKTINQPPETGAEVLTCSYGVMEVLAYELGCNGKPYWSKDGAYEVGPPDYWMPLPNPPTKD